MLQCYFKIYSNTLYYIICLACIFNFMIMLRLSYLHNAPICPSYQVYGALTTLDLHDEITSLLQYESEIIQAHTPHSYTLIH